MLTGSGARARAVVHAPPELGCFQLPGVVCTMLPERLHHLGGYSDHPGGGEAIGGASWLLCLRCSVVERLVGCPAHGGEMIPSLWSKGLTSLWTREKVQLEKNRSKKKSVAFLFLLRVCVCVCTEKDSHTFG